MPIDHSGTTSSNRHTPRREPAVTPLTTPSQPPARAAGAWLPWLLAMAFFSLVVAMAVGILKSLGGAALPEVVLAGGTAFGATMGACLAAITAVKELRRIT